MSFRHHTYLGVDGSTSFERTLLWACSLLLLLCLWGNTTQGQGEANNWRFGQFAGITFSDCSSPVSTGPHPMIISEGCTSISDKDGSLQFYSDGETVWDRNGVVMPNGTGLLGNSSITQNALAIKKPGNNPIYYLVTNGGGHYSEIDMSLNGGFGDVTIKNVIIPGDGSEKVTAVNHANGTDVWVIKFNSVLPQNFGAFLVTSAGFSLSPVISFGAGGGSGFGQLKCSPDGSWLGSSAGTSTGGGANIYPFDNATGMAGTAISVSTNVIQDPYGLAFSPDGSKVYVTLTFVEEVFQFDLSLGNPAAIQASGMAVGNWPAYNSYALQLAPDGRVYGVHSAGSHLFRINDPNLPGPACNYQAVALNLAPNTGNYLGLPGYNASIFFKPAYICFESPCSGDTTRFEVPINNSDSVYWDFDDPSTGAANNSTMDEPWHIFSDTGSYNVTLVLYYPNETDTMERTVYIYGKPTVDLGNDTTLCAGQSYVVDVNHVFATGYSWNTGSDSSAITIDAADHYWATLDYECGIVSDSVHVDHFPDPTPNLGPDTALCATDSLVLTLPGTNINYTWSNGSTDSSLTVYPGDTVWVSGSNFCGQGTDTLIATELTVPQIQIVGDTAACQGDTLTLMDSTSFQSILWSTSNTTAYTIPTTTGWYSVTGTHQCGTSEDSIFISSLVTLSVDLGPDTTYCGTDTFWLNSGQTIGTHTWQDGSTDMNFPVVQTGTYHVTVNTYCGNISDTINVQQFTNPVVHLGPDTTLCVNDSLVLNAQHNGSWYLWQDNSSDSTLVVFTENTYWVTTSNPCGTFSDTIQVSQDDSLMVNLGTDTTICQGDTLTLNSFLDPDNPHLWQDSSTLNSYAVWVGGSYWVLVRNVCGPVSDTIVIHFESAPVVDLGPDVTYCMANGLTLESAEDATSYVWNTGETTPSITTNSSGLYWSEATTVCGTDRDSVLLTGEVLPTIALDSIIGGCIGEWQTVQPLTDANTINWSTGDTGKTVDLREPGLYWATAQNQCGIVTDSFTLVKDPVPTVDVIPDTFYCAFEEVPVTATSPVADIEWSTGTKGLTAIFDQPGIFRVAARNYCSTALDSIRVQEIPLPLAELPEALEICVGEMDTVTAQPSGVSYLWDDGSTAGFRIVEEPGIYTLTVTSPKGCIDQTSMEVRLCPSLWIPNAFTPNGDGKNDVFIVKGERLEEFDLRIFNRWGERIFQTNDPFKGWDGRYSGLASPGGVYTWELHYLGPELRQKVRHGTVRLIR